MNKNKKTILLIFILLTLLLQAQMLFGEEIEQNITYNNETWSIQPTKINFDANTTYTNIFRIERLNYTTGDEEKTINYQEEIWKKENNTLKEKRSISKTIRKYSSAQTGYLHLNEGEYELHFKTNEYKLKWNINVSKIQNTNNATETNTTTEITNQTNTTRTNTSETNNNTTNNENNNTNNNANENNETCFEIFKIRTDKNIYAKGEQTKINFLLEPQPENFTIEYWIETINQSIAKQKKETTNLNEKHFTSRTKKTETYIIRAKAKDNCHQKEEEKLFAVKTENENEEEEKEKETRIQFTKIEEQNTHDQKLILVTIETRKGKTTKSVVDVYITNKEGKTISPHFKIKLPEQNTLVENTFSIPLYKKPEQILIKAKGLGLEEIEVKTLDQEEKEEEKEERKSDETKETIGSEEKENNKTEKNSREEKQTKNKNKTPITNTNTSTKTKDKIQQFFETKEENTIKEETKKEKKIFLNTTKQTIIKISTLVMIALLFLGMYFTRKQTIQKKKQKKKKEI